MTLAITYVGLAVLLGWALRGQYGHQLGASIPGALFGLALVLVSGREDWIQRAPVIAAAGAIGFAVGGSASYGRLIGYTRAKRWTNILYGFACLFVVGALWGVVGGGIVGLALEPEPPGAIRLALLFAGMAAGAYVGFDLLIRRCGIRMTPPRSDAWACEFGAALVLIPFLAIHDCQVALRGAVFGLFGYGVGFVVGNFLQVLGNVSGIPIGWWKVMEKTMGFVGGLTLAYGLLTANTPAVPAVGSLPNWTGILVVGVVIPWMVLVKRLTVERMTNRLRDLPFEETGHTVRRRLTAARVSTALCTVATLAVVLTFETGRLTPHHAWLALLAFLALGSIVMSNLQSGFPRSPFASASVEVSLWVEWVVLVAAGAWLSFDVPTAGGEESLGPPSLIPFLSATVALLLAVATVSFLAMREDLPGAHLRWGPIDHDNP